MAATQLGATLIIGGQRTLTNYIVESDEVNDANVVSEDVEDADGKLATRIIFRNEDKVKLSLICKSGASPATEFPVGAMCTITGLTTYFVDSAPIVKAKGAQKVSVEMTKIL
jgi:hypothetical protein